MEIWSYTVFLLLISTYYCHIVHNMDSFSSLKLSLSDHFSVTPYQGPGIYTAKIVAMCISLYGEVKIY